MMMEQAIAELRTEGLLTLDLTAHQVRLTGAYSDKARDEQLCLEAQQAADELLIERRLPYKPKGSSSRANDPRRPLHGREPANCPNLRPRSK